MASFRQSLDYWVIRWVRSLRDCHCYLLSFRKHIRLIFVLALLTEVLDFASNTLEGPIFSTIGNLTGLRTYRSSHVEYCFSNH